MGGVAHGRGDVVAALPAVFLRLGEALLDDVPERFRAAGNRVRLAVEVLVGKVSLGKRRAAVDELVEHASLLSSAHDSAMAGACSRLADSETRVNATDQILDAVIGMEAILLAGLGDQKGELRYRFSINYSTLFDTPQSKLEGFRVAKKLYDLRCVVAHGDTIDSKQCRLGDKVLSLGEWGRLASDTLRSLVKKFLPADPKKSYKNSDFWEEAYFGIR